jgi:hypothetical protein
VCIGNEADIAASVIIRMWYDKYRMSRKGRADGAGAGAQYEEQSDRSVVCEQR